MLGSNSLPAGWIRSSLGASGASVRLFACVMCGAVCISSSGYTHTRVRLQILREARERPKCLPQLLFISFFETRPLTESGAHWLS